MALQLERMLAARLVRLLALQLGRMLAVRLVQLLALPLECMLAAQKEFGMVVVMVLVVVSGLEVVLSVRR